jgi:hypothetical protein
MFDLNKAKGHKGLLDYKPNEVYKPPVAGPQAVGNAFGSARRSSAGNSEKGDDNELNNNVMLNKLLN